MTFNIFMGWVLEVMLGYSCIIAAASLFAPKAKLAHKVQGFGLMAVLICAMFVLGCFVQFHTQNAHELHWRLGSWSLTFSQRWGHGTYLVYPWAPVWAFIPALVGALFGRALRNYATVLEQARSNGLDAPQAGTATQSTTEA